MASWPLVGRIIRIGVAVIRLPELRAAYLDSNHRQHVFETEQLPSLLQTISDLNHRQHVFETEQLPSLLQTISDLNHRQLSNDNDTDNLVKSVPVALRKITRDLIEIRSQLESVSSSMDQRLIETRGQLEGVSSSMDQRLIETRGQLEVVSGSVGYLFGRVEFVRRELMFEMRYGTKVPNSNVEQIKTKVVIVNSEKLTASRKNRLRLNLGCGHIAQEGYINVDRRALPGVDIVAEVDELPFEPGEIDEIFSAHLLEHFPQEQLRRELLPYYYSLLKEGGIFRAVVPDAEAMIQKYTQGEYPYDDMREVMYGAQDYDGDFHFNMFTPESIKKLLEEAGFTEVRINAAGRPNGKCFELEITAKK